MTTQEIREMLDSTITSNGRKEISGKTLNVALNAILDLIGEGGGGFGGSAITVLLPRNDHFKEDVVNAELIANNKKCFEALKNQTKPMLIFLQNLGSSKPFSQVALRLRHLHTVGEGTNFFAFGYPATYSNEHIIGGLAMASDMYAIYEDGTTKKIDYDGIDVNLDVMDFLCGVYNHSATSTGGATLGSMYLPKIYKSLTAGKTYISNLFGANSENVPGTNYEGPTAEVEYYKDSNTLVVKGGWTHNMLGPIEDDIVFNVDLQTGTLTTAEETITVAGWATITGYTLTKMQ